MALHFPALSLLALPLLLIGCSKVTPGGDKQDAALVDAMAVADAAADAMPPGPCEKDSIAIDDLLPCIVEAQCEWGVRCEEFVMSIDECIEMFSREANSGLARTTESIAAGRTIYDGTEASACLTSFNDASCDGEPGENCQQVFIGTIADGEACLIRDECSGVDARCDDKVCQDQCCEGTCQNTAPINSDCSVRRCDNDAHCVANICQTGDVDSTCSEDFHCDDENHCGPDSKCVPDLALDAQCKSNGQCARPATCLGEGANPGYCALIDVPGAPCDGFCRGGLRCQTQSGNTIGVCVEKSGEGGSCEQNNHCVDELFCLTPDNVCKTKPILTESCTTYTCVDGFFCTAELPAAIDPIGVCVEPQAADLSCNSDSHCESDICGDGSKVCENYLSCY